ncbi:DUF4349 domain-containing protein [Clostridiaceae bacterium HSG29]|nr:DUF4349 domain-containing protein [Clostridiaceae bacterium HSG29]
MNCNEARKYISSLVDEELDIDIKDKVNSHIENCDECKKIYEEEKLIKKLLNESELKELPYGFDERLHSKLENEAKSSKKSNKVIKFVNKNRKYLAIAAAFIFVVVLVNNNPLNMGRGSSEYSKDMAMEESASVEMHFNESVSSKSQPMLTMTMESSDEKFGNEAPMPEVEAQAASIESEYQTGRIIIKNSNMQLDILNFEKTADDIKNYIQGYDGYVSNMSSNIRYTNENGKEFKYGYLEVKIKSESFDEFIDFVENLGKVRNTNLSTQDVTNAYRDTVSSIKNLEITQDRLRDILTQSEKVEETLQIERELTRVRGQIDQLKGNVKNWDRLSKYATINISLNEVEELEVTIQPIDNSIFKKATDGLMNTINIIREFLERLFVNIIAYSPFIFTIIVGIAIFRKFYKKRGIK